MLVSFVILFPFWFSTFLQSFKTIYAKFEYVVCNFLKFRMSKILSPGKGLSVSEINVQAILINGSFFQTLKMKRSL